ncbi:MAG: hypothetical protein JSV21_01330 [Nitrospirota bacterium]|nr:MAG: hypothetical protein JSV21_01330 [Nitrospirota bacterium]
MKVLNYSKLSRFSFLFILVLICFAISGCFAVTRYTDGPVTQYLTEPIPKLKKPIARTVSLEKVKYNTAANMKAIMISDLVAREIYVLPEDVGNEVKELLELDKKFSKKATYKALNIIARNRDKARSLSGKKIEMNRPSTGPADASSARYIEREERRANEARRKGDYVQANIHSSAAMNNMMISQSFQRAQATVDVAFATLGAVQAAGQGIIKGEFIKLRNWIEFESGAIGDKAPAGTHLSVFVLQFFDAKSFQLDSRNRVAVLLVLIDKNGKPTSVLEGSDILVCEGECNLFQPKPTAKVVDKTTQSEDVREQLGTPDGSKYMMKSGFDPVNQFYDYIMLQHGLKKLSRKR